MHITITPDQAAERYGLNKGTLANMRSKKEGPPYLKRGRKIFYKVSDLEAWLFAGSVKTLSEVRG